MKTAINIDFLNNRILMTKTFANRASDVRSEEYEVLQKARRDYPTFTVEIRTIKRNPYKKTYAGLTFQYMRDYICTHGSAEERRKNLDEFEEMLLISQCHSKPFRYPTIKKWFLERYPAILDFGAEFAETGAAAGEVKTAPTAPEAA